MSTLHMDLTSLRTKGIVVVFGVTKMYIKENVFTYCFASSPRRPYVEYKRMVLEHTHGLFIT
jgi:hypothetical protein